MKYSLFNAITILIAFILACSFTKTKDSFSYYISKSFAVELGSTVYTSPSDLYESYARVVLEAPTYNPTINNFYHLEAAAEDVFETNIDNICYDAEGEVICLARVSKNTFVSNYILDFYYEGEFYWP